MTAFASVVLDADSTLASLEGIDWLARARGHETVQEVAALTDAAMAGEVPLESVYTRRLEIIAPSRDELARLGQVYVEALLPGAAIAVATLREAGLTLRVVSGGLRPALLPMTRVLGFSDDHVHAVEMSFAADGTFAGVRDSPLTTHDGKAGVVRGLSLPGPILAVGDGATDLAMRPAVDAFAAFVAVVRRRNVVDGADHVLESFSQLAPLALHGKSPIRP